MTRLGVGFKGQRAPRRKKQAMTDIDPDPAEFAAPDDARADTGGPTATALAEPPQPPVVPPGANATGEAPRPRGNRVWVVVAILAALLALALMGVVGYLAMTTLSPRSIDSSASSPAAQAAFESAMSKAGVKAQPPAQPVAIDSVQASGSHTFSATFTPEEMAALVNNFPYASSLAGVDIALAGVTLAIPEAGSVKLSAEVSVNNGTHSGSVTAPAAFSNGLITSPGATSITVDGIPTSGAQKTQVSDALLRYFNAYLVAAPGLHIDTASIGADGFTVTGTAPDSLTYP
jgi:hypothetical protein